MIALLLTSPKVRKRIGLIGGKKTKQNKTNKQTNKQTNKKKQNKNKTKTKKQKNKTKKTKQNKTQKHKQTCVMYTEDWIVIDSLLKTQWTISVTEPINKRVDYHLNVLFMPNSNYDKEEILISIWRKQNLPKKKKACCLHYLSELSYSRY